ncbi:MAG: PD40 domain-containing protein [Gemmatimonadota bacterium]|nr:MAG: PD40 domain-containing protein [Gemmatimonadota bacterium]
MASTVVLILFDSPNMSPTNGQMHYGARNPLTAIAMPAIVLAFLGPATAAAQVPVRDSIPTDVRVGILYQPSFRPGIVMPLVPAPQGLREVADSARRIILRDLDYSDRLQVMPVGEDVPIEGPINYGLWDELEAVWLLVGAVEGTPDQPVLRLSLHDVVFRLLQEVRAFELPPLAHPGFRHALHTAADAVVRWATSSAGIATTRIAYVAEGPGGSEIYVVDSDGFGARRLSSDSSIALSPAWSPTGDRIAFMSYKNGDPAIYEIDADGGRSVLSVDLPGMDLTPTYTPDGTRLGFAATIDGRTEVYTYDLVRNCCPERATFARYANSLSPTFAPDGRRFAFNSDRLGQLHVFVQGMNNGSAELITPYIYDRSVHNAGPDWSPTGDRIAFHGWVGGEPQIFTVAPDGRGLRQLTQRGRNEDPSWAPDGRHIIFASTRDGATGLWVLDVVSGRIRRLVSAAGARLPDWSGRLDSASQLTSGAAVGSESNNR